MYNTVPIHHPQIRANLFNEFFSSTFTQSNFSLPPIESLLTPSSQLHHITILYLDVATALSELDTTKAAGCDNIHPRILKVCSTSLTHAIMKLFSLNVEFQYIPNDWKLHKIWPTPKKGDLSIVKNYRPISLLPII